MRNFSSFFFTLASVVAGQMITVRNYYYSEGYTSLIRMNVGFAIVIYNTVSYYITIPVSGDCKILTEGTPSSLISGIDYSEGCVRVKMNYVTQMNTVIYAPNGEVLI